MQNDQHLEPAELRSVLGAFATGITVVTTTNSKGEARAITVNSFTSVSLDPPLVLFCLDKAAFNYECFARAQEFAVNLLAADQEELSNRFAGEVEDGCEGLGIYPLETGSPVFPEILAAIDCRRHATHEAGDHLIIIGRVVQVKAPRDADPLLYFRGRYARLRR